MLISSFTDQLSHLQKFTLWVTQTLGLFALAALLQLGIGPLKMVRTGNSGHVTFEEILHCTTIWCSVFFPVATLSAVLVLLANTTREHTLRFHLFGFFLIISSNDLIAMHHTFCVHICHIFTPPFSQPFNWLTVQFFPNNPLDHLLSVTHMVAGNSLLAKQYTWS